MVELQLKHEKKAYRTLETDEQWKARLETI